MIDRLKLLDGFDHDIKFLLLSTSLKNMVLSFFTKIFGRVGKSQFSYPKNLSCIVRNTADVFSVRWNGIVKTKFFPNKRIYS